MAADRYNPQTIEGKWSRVWAERDIYRTDAASGKPKFYCLVMFPYPSGDGLSVGHLRNYIPADVVARCMRMRGFEVLHPMGWDAFGLPAEQDAIDKGLHPADTTKRYAANYRRQLTLVGCGYDWDREIDSSNPEYYHWTQWFFLLLHERGLAYRAQGMQWWCPTCGALANEEVLADGTCWRGHSGVDKRPLTQWFFKITKYADRLIDDLDLVDWPENTKRMQVNWVGRSEGADAVFRTETGDELKVFTTRPDTLFGATFMVLAPEHPLVPKLTTPENREAVEAYAARSRVVSEIDRSAAEREKTGVDTGSFAINPVNGERVPIWVADYVLMTYGTGAIMAVPAHDERDFAFAKKFGLPIRTVIAPAGWSGEELVEAYLGPGAMVNSGPYDGLSWLDGGAGITLELQRKGCGGPAVAYRMRDWLISRQRYWGCPIPIVHCPSCGEVPVPKDQLPVMLPHVQDFAPLRTHGSPLEGLEDWVNTTCPDCGKPAKRETDTLGGFACSSWYFLRFISPHFDGGPFEPTAAARWMPVDLYVGGAEHAVMHLLYARFWYKVMYDAGLVAQLEPFAKLRHQGMLLAEDGWVRAEEVRVTADRASAKSGRGVTVYAEPDAGSRVVCRASTKAEFDVREHGENDWIAIRGGKMSKSMGNVVTPDDVVAKFGADCLRGFALFMAPMDGTLPWNESGLNGLLRFYNKLWNLVLGEVPQRKLPAHALPLAEGRRRARRIVHKAIKKCTEDLENLRFNTMVANGLMETVNALYEIWSPELAASAEGREATKSLNLLVAPVAPYLAEELWDRTRGQGSVHHAPWPKYELALAADETVTLVVQVNGKLRDRLEVAPDIDEERARALALSRPNVAAHVDGREIKTTVFVPGRLLNLVVG